MKTFATIALIASIGFAQATDVISTPVVSEWYDPLGLLTKTKEQNKDTFIWLIDGVKGSYDGYYSSFYKTSRSKDVKDCLNTETVENIIDIGATLADPMSLFTNFDFTKDIALVG